MFRSSWSREDQQALERVAKKLEVDLDAEDVAGTEATFASIEAAARKVGQAVTRHVCEDLAIKQTQLLKEPQPCPSCQKLCGVEVRQRSLTTGDGPIDVLESVCHCSACRRDFFPSACSIGASSTRF